MLHHDILNSPYYIVKKIENKDKSKVNDSHDDVLGKRCTIISLHVGRSAQLLVDVDYDYSPHRFWTSAVQRVVMTGDDVSIETKNSKYLLVQVREESE